MSHLARMQTLPFNLSSHAYLGFGIFFSDCYSYRIAESSSNQCLDFICLSGREQALRIDNMVNCERWNIQPDTSEGERKIWVPDRNRTHDLRTQGGRSIHWATRTHGEQGHFNWVHMWQVSCIPVAYLLITTHDEFSSADPRSVQCWSRISTAEFIMSSDK